MKTSYYIGYEDLDNKLHILYDVQVILESNHQDTTETILKQDKLIAEGKVRDEAKSHG